MFENCEINSIDESTECSEALRLFIKRFEISPELWNCADRNYYSKTARTAALDRLVPFLARIKPGAKREDVKKKINSLRTNFRKELKKIAISKMSGNSPGKEYKPTAWSFYALSFLERFENPIEQQQSEAEEQVGVYFTILQKKYLNNFNINS
uniref:MADF domain-containing protein n=1 Tax=Clastoptera arizonana TaxID=38151 RepID=A0A1B6DCP3_9HEMI